MQIFEKLTHNGIFEVAYSVVLRTVLKGTKLTTAQNV